MFLMNITLCFVLILIGGDQARSSPIAEIVQWPKFPDWRKFPIGARLDVPDWCPIALARPVLILLLLLLLIYRFLLHFLT